MRSCSRASLLSLWALSSWNRRAASSSAETRQTVSNTDSGPHSHTQTLTKTKVQVHVPTGCALNTFLEGFVDVYLARGKVLVVLHVRENSALVDPVVVVGTEEEDGEVADVVP